jgi:hypothetical protein
MTTRPTRRAILAGAAAVPIAALASVAPSSAEALEPAASPISDPVFAAIEKHRRLNARYLAVLDELNELEEALPDEIKRRPRAALYRGLDGKVTRIEQPDCTLLRLERGLPTGKMCFANSHAQINEAARDIPKEHRAVWLADRHAALKADKRALREAQKASGLASLQKRFSTAGNAAYKAGEALIGMRPPTIAGTLALVAYAIECRDDLMPDDDDPYILLDSVAMALSSHVPGEIARSIG